jgi:hypothetical protein
MFGASSTCFPVGSGDSRSFVGVAMDGSGDSARACSVRTAIEERSVSAVQSRLRQITSRSLSAYAGEFRPVSVRS